VRGYHQVKIKKFQKLRFGERVSPSKTKKIPIDEKDVLLASFFMLKINENYKNKSFEE
jgi:hypothetical protein